MSNEERTAATARAIEEAQDLRDNLTVLIGLLDRRKPSQAMTDEVMETVRRIHASVPYVEWRAVHALRLGGATWRQIGEAMDITPQAAQQRWTPDAWIADRV